MIPRRTLCSRVIIRSSQTGETTKEVLVGSSTNVFLLERILVREILVIYGTTKNNEEIRRNEAPKMDEHHDGRAKSGDAWLPSALHCPMSVADCADGWTPQLFFKPVTC